MKTNIFFLAIITSFVATSCTIEQSINYNDDMSGSNEIIIDYGDFVSQMGALLGDSSSMNQNLPLNQGLDSLDKTFEGIEGINNVAVIGKMEEHKMGFSFDFDDTKALNEAIVNYSDMETGKKKKDQAFRAKGKKLFINLDNQKINSLDEGLSGQQMMGMMGMFDYKISITLPKPVKSVDNKLYLISADRKTIEATVNFEEYLNHEESLSAKIKW